jgi:hypothetical protein
MRITSTFWIGFGLLALCALLVFGINYGSDHLSDPIIKTIKDYAGFAFLLIVGGPIVYILYSLLTTGVSEYADGIFEIFLDSNDKDIHVFTYNRVISTKSSGGATRLIQHYFMVADTGKSYYKVLFSHSMDTKDGAMDGFESFGNSVLQGQDLKDRFKELAKSTGFKPDLGQILKRDENDLYKIGDHRGLRVGEVSKLFGKRLSIVYLNTDYAKVLWNNRI